MKNIASCLLCGGLEGAHQVGCPNVPSASNIASRPDVTPHQRMEQLVRHIASGGKMSGVYLRAVDIVKELDAR